EREDRVYAHITGAGGEQYREILLSTSPREGVVRRGQEAVVAPVSEAEPDVVAVADSPAEFGEHHDPLPAGPVALGSASVAEAALDASNQDAKEARVLHEGDVIDQGISRGYRPYKAGENEPLATLAYTDTLTGEKLRDLATQTVQDPERADIDAIEEFITARATVVVDGKPVEIRGEHAEKVYLNPKIMSLEDAREIEEIGDAGIARYLEEYPVEEGKAYHDVPVFVTRNNVVLPEDSQRRSIVINPESQEQQSISDANQAKSGDSGDPEIQDVTIRDGEGDVKEVTAKAVFEGGREITLKK